MSMLRALRGNQVWIDGGLRPARLLFNKDRIAAIESVPDTPPAADELDFGESWVLPGLIDSQVHFREPGLEHKENLASGSRSAVAGGMTAFLEMPNTKPATISAETMSDKVQRASRVSWCDFGFFIGAAAENADKLHELEQSPGCCGVKVFMGSSTGSLLVPDDETLRRVLANGSRRVAVHAEDEPRLLALKDKHPEADHPGWHPLLRDPECSRLAVERLLRIAQETGRKIHVLHVNTAEEMDLFRSLDHGLLGEQITVELTPQHLLLQAPECYTRLGSFAQMNPPIREAGHREALWSALQDGTVTCLGSDHAPHTREEKGQGYPGSPSGMPGVETLLPLMLDQVLCDKLTLARLVELLAEAPARIYSIEDKGWIRQGMRADFTVVNPLARVRLDEAKLQSRCGWSAFHDAELRGAVESVILRGSRIWHEGQFLGDPKGCPLQFQ